MTKKLVKSLLLILIIPIIFTIIICTIYTKKYEYTPIVSYKNNTNITEKDNNIYKDDELKYGDNIYNAVSQNYTTILVFGIGLSILFAIVYAATTKKKGW